MEHPANNGYLDDSEGASGDETSKNKRVKIMIVEDNSVEKEDANSDNEDDEVDINDDVYNMFFLSRNGGPAFYYAAYVFALKMALYTFLAIDSVYAVERHFENDTPPTVLAAQFLMLPVAVAMQDDLCASFNLVANIRYSPKVLEVVPEAYQWKFNVANIARGIDGVYSLLVNFAILIKAKDVLTLFLNFAALQFLQYIDNTALSLSADGYLGDRLEEVAKNVMSVKLPKKSNSFFRTLDSVLFLSTLSIMIISWAVVQFAPIYGRS